MLSYSDSRVLRITLIWIKILPDSHKLNAVHYRLWWIIPAANSEFHLFIYLIIRNFSILLPITNILVPGERIFSTTLAVRTPNQISLEFSVHSLRVFEVHITYNLIATGNVTWYSGNQCCKGNISYLDKVFYYRYLIGNLNDLNIWTILLRNAFPFIKFQFSLGIKWFFRALHTPQWW